MSVVEYAVTMARLALAECFALRTVERPERIYSEEVSIVLFQPRVLFLPGIPSSVNEGMSERNTSGCMLMSISVENRRDTSNSDVRATFSDRVVRDAINLLTYTVPGRYSVSVASSTPLHIERLYGPVRGGRTGDTYKNIPVSTPSVNCPRARA